MFRAELLKTKLVKVLDQVETSEKITAVKFKELKSGFNRYMQEVWSVAVTEPTCGSRDPILHELYWVSRPESHTFNSTRKQVNALAKKGPSEQAAAVLNAAIKVLDDNEALLAKVLAIKPLVGQRGERAPSRTAPVVPVASQQAKESIRTMLSGIADNKREDLIAMYMELFEHILKHYESLSYEEATSYVIGNDYAHFVVTCFTHNPKGAQKAVRHENTNAFMLRKAKEQTEHVINRYVAKMVEKLGALIDLMGEPEKLDYRYSSKAGHLSGWIEVSYADGRAYTAVTSLEWSHSIYGKPFTRYPCRFKHVHSAGGALVARAMSEAQMLVFAGTK